MARGNRAWGMICPDDGGILLDGSWGDRVWCPSNEHGGNGKFFSSAEVKEGWALPSTSTGSGLTESQIRELRNQQTAAAESAGVPDVPIDVTAQGKKPKAAKAPKAAQAAAQTAPADREPRFCECGCGGQTKGGRFIPGHDARLHSRWNAQAKAAGYPGWKDAQAAGFAFDTEEAIAPTKAE